MSDQSPSTQGRAFRFGIAGWPLRRKVASALAVPLLLAATFGGMQVNNDLDQSNNASVSAKQVTVLQPAIDYLTAAEKGMVAAQASVGTMQSEQDAALVDLRTAAVELEKASDSSFLTFEQHRQVDVILDLSRVLRDEAGDPVSPGTWIAQVRQMQSGVTKLITTIVSAQNTPQPRLDLLSQALGGRFALAQQQALAAGERTGSSIDAALYAEYGAERVALDRLAGQKGVNNSFIQTLRTNNAERAREGGDSGSVLGGAGAYDEYDKLQTALLDAVGNDLDKRADVDLNAAAFQTLLTLVALTVAIGLAFLISRSLVNPIRRVREGALKVARQDLPDAVKRIRAGDEPGPIRRIDVTTHEEVGQLARAVDDLHQQAVTLAAGEAQVREQVGEMFVTLSRRNTTLINQQLNLIEALERDEEDPKRLESLFRLDHLASRMRRTSDSLLILADAPTRSAGWESVSVAETLQAATAGVTNYQRVRPESSLETKVDESAAGDLVHLLTELVDNSLSYSSPNTTVVLAATTGDNGVTITVADAGLGIPVDELKVINDNLSTGVEVTPDTARRMGLFVVSRLAQRHGIRVSLKANRGDGMTAYVFVPNAILPERAHLETVPFEDEVEEVFEPVVQEPTAVEQVEEPVAELIDIAPLTVVPNLVDTIEDQPTDLEDTEEADTEPTPSTPKFDASDPLGIGDAYLKPVSEGLPTRQRGATLPSLASAGVQIPSKDASGNDEAPAVPQMKRPTAAMPLRSKRTLDAGAPAAAAVQDPPREPEAQEPVAAEVEATEVTEVTEVTGVTGVTEAADVFTTPSALDEPAAYVVEEPAVEEAAEPAAVEAHEPAAVETHEPAAVESHEPAVVEEPAGFEPATAETIETIEAELAETVEPVVVEAAAANISALMAKIRPQRGRLPIPDYDEVDHAEILRGGGRDRSALNAAPAPAVETSYAEPAQPAYSERAFASFVPEHPVPVGATVLDATPPATEARRDEEPAINGATKSSWLSSDEEDHTWTSTEVEAGWQRADTVATSHIEPTSDAGLPVRSPGARLVPGSVTKPVGAGGRDPEAIRARLSAHKAGVRRGRTSPVSADDQ